MGSGVLNPGAVFLRFVTDFSPISTHSVSARRWAKTGATQYHSQLGLPDKGRAIMGLVGCYCML